MFFHFWLFLVPSSSILLFKILNCNSFFPHPNTFRPCTSTSIPSSHLAA
uniref:Uncharacterized protein n=1 Tax=Rhizophora mucronata TaxID=61149 RepID=A0A2P2QSK2_RHIMU